MDEETHLLRFTGGLSSPMRDALAPAMVARGQPFGGGSVSELADTIYWVQRQ